MMGIEAICMQCSYFFRERHDPAVHALDSKMAGLILIAVAKVSFIYKITPPEAPGNGPVRQEQLSERAR